MKKFSKISSLAPFISLVLPHFTFAQDEAYVAPDVNIISVTPVQGTGIELDRVPSNIQTITEEDFQDKKNLSVTETLNRKAAGISISNLNSSPMQNDINFRTLYLEFISLF